MLLFSVVFPPTDAAFEPFPPLEPPLLELPPLELPPPDPPLEPPPEPPLKLVVLFFAAD